MLSLLGAWGRTENFRHHVITTSSPDDLLWDGEISSKPTPESERSDTGYVFHDISWKQKVLNLATFLPLNLIGRNQERLQVARALSVAHLCSCRILSIQVDGIYMQFPKKEDKRLEKRFRSIRYCDLNSLAAPKVLAKQTPNSSQALVYKCEEKEPRYPGGTLKVAEHVDPPIPEAMAWNII